MNGQKRISCWIGDYLNSREMCQFMYQCIRKCADEQMNIDFSLIHIYVLNCKWIDCFPENCGGKMFNNTFC